MKLKEILPLALASDKDKPIYMGGLGQMGVGVPIAHTAKTQTVVTSL